MIVEIVLSAKYILYKIRHHRLVCFVAGKVVLLPAYRSLLMEQYNIGYDNYYHK